MKRMIFLVLACLMSLFSAFADALGDFVASRAINAPETAILITDLKSGEIVAAHNARKPLIPASIMKCITTATLLEKVGFKYVYETPVQYSGSIADGVLRGNLIVVASGDPSINTVHEPGSANLVSEIVGALKTLRVDSVAGMIVVDESRFPGPSVNPTWQSADLPHSYGTGTHGFNFEDNASGKKSVANPANVFRTRLKTAMNQAGIKFGGNNLADNGSHHRLLVHKSERVDDIMRSCMMRSDNQFAESMMRTVGLKYADTGSTSAGTKETMNYWRNHHADMEGVNIVDGSGLSRTNRVTAQFMSDVLRHMSRDPYYASFFPLAGQEGTLRKFLAGTPLEGEIAMKTGSMSGIQCYAGYMLDEEYAPTHTVVVIMNQMADRNAARAELQKLLLNIFKPQSQQ